MQRRSATVGVFVFATLFSGSVRADEKNACWEKLRTSVDDGCACFQTLAARDRAPDIVLDWGKCEQRRGRAAAAMRLYQEARPGYLGSPDVIGPLDAQIAALAPQLGHLGLRKGDGAKVAQPRFEVDGEALVAGETWVEPGQHEIRLLDGDRPVDATTLVVTAGSEVVVVLPRATPPAPRVAAPTSPVAGNDGPRDASEDDGAPPATIAGAVTLAIGGIGLAGAIVTGAMIVDAYDTAEAAGCPRCDGEARDTVERGASLLGLNVASWIVAAVGVSAGITLVVVGETTGDSDAARVSLGIGGVMVDGTF